MPDARPEPDLARHGRQLATLFTVLFWFGAVWLFAESWIPMKRLAAAAWVHDTTAFQHAWRAAFRLALQMAPAIAMLVALSFARDLFDRFGRGEVLTPANGEGLLRLGGALVAAAFLSLFALPAHSGPQPLLLTADVMLGAVGFAILFIGQAWARAAAVQAELDQIV